jgi:hypothetical protein
MVQAPGGGGGGSSTPPDPNSYPVASWRVSADPSETNGLKWKQVKDYLDGTNAGQVANAGNAHNQASISLANLAGRMVTHAQLLSENWGGQSATQAIGQLQDLHGAATNAANANWQVGNVLSWYGNEILPWYVQNAPHPGTLGSLWEDVGGDDTAADTAAQQHLARLNDRIVQASNAYPAAVQMKLPPSTNSQGYGGGGSGGGAGAGGGAGGIPGGGIPGGGVPGGHVPGMPGGPGGGIPGGHVPGMPGSGGPGGGGPGGGIPGGGIPGGGIPGGGVPGGGPGSLSGYHPPSVPGGGFGGPGGGVPGGGLSGGPGGGGLGGGGLGGLPLSGGEALGGGLDGAGAGAGAGSGLAAEQAAAREAAAADGMAGRGGMMTPMMGGAGGGQGGKERERQTWLTEDEDFWGANEGDAAPPVIG